MRTSYTAIARKGFRLSEFSNTQFGKTYQDYFNLYYKGKKLVGVQERSDVVQRELNLCGYFCIITSEKMTAEQALIQYKGRDISEKLFSAEFTAATCTRMSTQ